MQLTVVCIPEEANDENQASADRIGDRSGRMVNRRNIISPVKTARMESP